MPRSSRPCSGIFHRWTGCVVALLSFLAFGVFSCGGAARGEPVRIALVIGDSAYATGSAPTALKDAGLVARTLSQAGFAVTAAGDVDRGRLESVFDGFLAEAANAGAEATILVYLAGYGLQYSGSVYVVPVGTTLVRDTDIPDAAVSVTLFMHRLEALPAKARVFVFDLARDPLVSVAGAPVAGGLPLFQPAAGTIVAMNAAPGTVAIPDVAPYGVYARALSEVIGTTSLPVSTQFERVRMRVATISAGANVPWNGGSIASDVSLGVPGSRGVPDAGSSSAPPRAGTEVKAVASPAEAAYVAAVSRDTLDAYAAFLAAYPDDPLAARMRTMTAVRREAVLWNETLGAGTDRAYWTYMRRYRRGPHFADAKRLLAMSRAALEPPPRFDIYFYTSAPLPQPWEAALVDRPLIALDDRAWRQAPAADVGMPAPDPAFHEDLPPPPLAPAGTVPIANPVARRDGTAITQPDVPSIGSIVCETRFEPDGSWIASSLVEGKPIFATRASRMPDADLTALQTGPEGTVLSRTRVTREKGTTTIVQTGPSGGILTKAVTRGDGAGGRSTLLTNGGNQLVAIVQVDSQGRTIAKRGPVSASDQILVLGAKPIVLPENQVAAPPPPPVQAIPAFEPQPPPPLAMPASLLPAPPAPVPGPAPTVPVPAVPGKIVPQPSSPAATANATPVGAAHPVAELPRIAPLPPRRAKPVQGREPAPVSHHRASPAPGKAARHPVPGRGR